METMKGGASVCNNNNGNVPCTSRVLIHSQKPEGGSVSHNLRESIACVLARWNGLQMAVQNHWGGHDSLQKSQKLAADIFSWFSQSKGPLYVEDVENMLHESMLLTFNTDIEDGSIEEVAEQLTIMHEEYLQGGTQNDEN